MVEYDSLETKSQISPVVSENDTSVTRIVDTIPSLNGCVNIFQTDDLLPDYIKESSLDSTTNNVLKIVLPLVNENVPLNCQLNEIEYDHFFSKESHVDTSNNHIQYSPQQCVDMPVSFNKNINNRNHSLPEDNELNRFSSTFENIKTLLKEGLVDGLDEKPPDFQPPDPPLLYRVSSLPNLLSHDSTKSQNSCSYLTMCATKQELIMNTFCKNMVVKHDMSVQVSTELFKNQNEKILVDTSCQTEDIYVENKLNELLIKETNDNDCQTIINILNNEHEMQINRENEMKNNINNDCVSIAYTNVGNTVCEIKANYEEDCTNIDYTNIDILNEDYEVIANEENCTSVGYININAFDKEILNSNRKDSFPNVSYTNITTFSKECEMKSHNEDFPRIEYSNINDNVDNINEVNGNEDHSLNNGYNNINIFDKELKDETYGKDCVDIGYTNFSLYDKGLEIDSNDDCENYANANILEEFVNEQLSLNNVDGDFDSFLFGPLPPSPIEEIGNTLYNKYKIFIYSFKYLIYIISYLVPDEQPILNGVERKRENSAPVPFIFNIHKNEPSTSIIKSRSIDAEFSHNFQQHQKIGTRSVSLINFN